VSSIFFQISSCQSEKSFEIVSFFFYFVISLKKSFEIFNFFPDFFMSIGFLFVWSNAYQINQPIIANGALSTRLLNKGDWVAICWYNNIYISWWILIYLQAICFHKCFLQSEKNWFQGFTYNFFYSCKKNSVFFTAMRNLLSKALKPIFFRLWKAFVETKF